MENSIITHFLPAHLKGSQLFCGESCYLRLNLIIGKQYSPSFFTYRFIVTIVSIQELGDVASKELFYEISFEENNEIAKRYESSNYESKGFYTEVTIQDFPIPGKAVYLLIKRRRWQHKTNPKEIIRNDYSF